MHLHDAAHYVQDDEDPAELVGCGAGIRPSDARALTSTCQDVGLVQISAYRLSWRSFSRTLIDVVIMAENGQEFAAEECMRHGVTGPAEMELLFPTVDKWQ